jgi:hypothetical protein
MHAQQQDLIGPALQVVDDDLNSVSAGEHSMQLLLTSLALLVQSTNSETWPWKSSTMN